MDGSNISFNLGQNLNYTEMVAEEDGPRIIATSYMMYKIGELWIKVSRNSMQLILD